MENKPGVIILGIEHQALGLLRQLSEQSIPCVLIDQDKYGPTLFSRYKDKFYLSPSYTSKDFWPWLKELVLKNGYENWIIIPTDDEQVRQLSENFNEVEEILKFPGIPWEKYQLIYDKRLAYEWTRKLDIPNPKTFIPLERNCIHEHNLSFPFIVKPAVKREFKKYSKKKAIAVNSSQELDLLINSDLKNVPIEELIFQEIIEGSGEQQWSYAGLFINGKPSAAYTACRLRQHPPDYGRASTYVIASYDKEVEILSKKIISELQFTGLAEVEWKRDLKDNQLKFFEVNARSWGWHSLSSRVVGNIPLMLYNYYTNDSQSFTEPTYGGRWIKWITDIPVVFDLMKNKKLKFNDYLKGIMGNLTSCDWDRKDPLPFFMQFLLLPYLIIKRGY